MKFKIGDIVKVYGHIDKVVNGFVNYMYGSKAHITGIASESEIYVEFIDTGWTSPVHPKQCRKVKNNAYVWISNTKSWDVKVLSLVPKEGFVCYKKVSK